MNTTVKVVGGILLGAAACVAAGLLLAPQSGGKTRKMIKKQSRKYSKEALELAGQYIDGMKKGYNKKLESIASNGKSSIDSLKDTIKI